MARQKIPTANTEVVVTDADTPGLPEMVEAVNMVAAINQQMNVSAQAVALQLGYEGTLAVGALEDEIRFYQRRTVESMLELGKRLLVLKELTPHGEFERRVEMLGFSYRSAARFMQAALKTSKSANLALLSTQVKSASVFLELVTHDDDALTAVAQMDDIDRMSASQLRHALRKERRDAGDSREDLEKVIAQKDKKLNDYALELERLQRMPPEAKEAERQRIENETLAQLQDASLKLMFEVQTFSQSVANCLAGTEPESAMQEAVCSTVRWLFQRIDEVAKGNGIPVDFAEMVTPSWMRDAMQRHGIEVEEV